MNRKQAKALNEFLDALSDQQRDCMVVLNLLDANVLANYRAGHIWAFGAGKDVRVCGTPMSCIRFDSTGVYTVHEPEIDWAKATSNGAWGQKFMFKDEDNDIWFGPHSLLGHFPDDEMPFRDGKGQSWEQCRPVVGFEVPEEWLK